MTQELHIPSISCVISTFNRPNSLLRLLEVLRTQAHVRWQEHEIIVVDDGSNTPIQDIAPDYLETFQRDEKVLVPVRYLYQPRDAGSPHLYRNMNWAGRTASKDVLWFVQDDLIFDDHSLFILQLLHAAYPNTTMWPHLANQQDPGWYQYPGSIIACIEEEQVYGYMWAGSSTPRKIWEEMGGVDEDFDGSMGFADQDFAIRAFRNPNVDVALVRGICAFLDDDESHGSWRNKILTPWRASHPGEHDPNGVLFWKKWPHRKPADA